MKSVLLAIGMVLLLFAGAASAEQYVQVDSSGQAIDQIYHPPDIGKIYLLVYITISNHGYDNVYTNPICFQVEVNKVKYGYDGASHMLSYIGKPMLDTVDLGDGGQISGYLVFQIPVDTTRYELIYNPIYPSENEKVRYNYT